MSSKFAVIMAGGKGERFWPESRESRPKQMLALFSQRTLIEETVLRIHRVIDYENILVVTNLCYVEKLRELLPCLPPENIIGEPERRDTAPCIALAAGLIKARDPEATMMIFPADHLITDVAGFAGDLELACREAGDLLVTIGIKPTFPSTDYGYIECAGDGKVSRVLRFVEKPDRARAEELLKAGNFCWNGGIFIWRIRSIEQAFSEFAAPLAGFMNEVAAKCRGEDFEAFLQENFARMPKISIDYAVMEKARNISVIRAAFDWDDVGSWSALRKHFPGDGSGNVIKGNAVLLDSEENIIFSEDDGHLIAGIGLKGMTVIHTGDVTLICPQKSSARLKELLKIIAEDPDKARFL